MSTSSQFIRSVCCDAPIRLAYMEGWEFTTDTLPVRCCRCDEYLGGAAREALPADTNQKVIDTQWILNELHLFMQLRYSRLIQPIIEPKGLINFVKD